MNTLPAYVIPERLSDKLIATGIRLTLTASLKRRISEKVTRLLRHEPRIDRVRIDLDHDKTRGVNRFVAKGRIEISGPDLIASADSEDAYKAIDLLIDTLDASLRRRSKKKTGPRNDRKLRIAD